MNYDPVLKKAMLEIEAILRKHDIGGVVSLTSKTHGEYLFVLDPSWTIIKQIPEEMGTKLHLRSMRKEFPSDEAQRKANELTAHLIFSQRDIAAHTLKQLGHIEDMLKSKWTIDHKVMKLEKTDYKA